MLPRPPCGRNRVSDPRLSTPRSNFPHIRAFQPIKIAKTAQNAPSEQRTRRRLRPKAFPAETMTARGFDTRNASRRRRHTSYCVRESSLSNNAARALQRCASTPGRNTTRVRSTICATSAKSCGVPRRRRTKRSSRKSTTADASVT